MRPPYFQREREMALKRSIASQSFARSTASVSRLQDIVYIKCERVRKSRARRRVQQYWMELGSTAEL